MILDGSISKAKWPGVKKNKGLSNGIPAHCEPGALTLKLAAFSL